MGASFPPFTNNTLITASNISQISKPMKDWVALLATQLEAERAPNSGDDATRGNKVGDLWLAPSRKVYKAATVTAGKAAWLPLLIGQTRPLDLVPGAIVAYGNKSLTASWLNGNWIDVATTAGGTPTTFKFVNGEPDLASLDKFLGGGVGYISKWYDQSGGGFDAIQTTGANQPIISINTVNGIRSICFNSFEVTGGYAGLLSKYMTIPSGAAFTQSTTTCFFVGQARSAIQTGSVAALGAGDGTTVNFYTANFVYNQPSMTIGSSIVAALGVAAPSSPSVLAWWNVGGATMTLFANNATASAASNAPFNTTTGGFLGNPSTGSFGPAAHDALAVILYSPTAGTFLTSAQVTNVRASLSILFGIAPQQASDPVWVADGDSITNGYGATYMQGYPRQVLEALPHKIKQFNIAQSGITLASQTPKFAANYQATYSATASRFVVTLHIGTNDIASGTTATALYTLLQAYVANLKALGSNVRVVVSTLDARNGLTGGQPTEFANFNTMVRNGWNLPQSGGGLGADYFLDVNADPVMGAAGAPSNTSLYVDGLHPTDLGYSYLTNSWSNVVGSALLQ